MFLPLVVFDGKSFFTLSYNLAIDEYNKKAKSFFLNLANQQSLYKYYRQEYYFQIVF